MELRHLRYSIAIAEEGHISRAAERLGIQQPPLSQQLKSDGAGAQRSAVSPQGARRGDDGCGARLLDDARAMLAHLDRAVETARRAARGEQGRLCIGVTSTTPFHPLVPRAIRAFREACPMVSLTVEECLSNESIDRLQNESMDAAFIRTSLSGSTKLAVVPLLEEPMVAALPATHPLAHESAEAGISMKRLAEEVFILYGPPGTGMYDAIIAACHAAGFNPRVGNLGASTQQAPRIGSTLSLVAAGLGVTCVPSSLHRMNLEGVVYRRIKPAEQPRTVLNLASRRGDPSAVVMQFVKIVRTVAKGVHSE